MKITVMKLADLHQQLMGLKELQSPIMFLLDKNNQFKLIAIGFKNGTILPNHSTARESKLIVVKGSLLYKENNQEAIVLNELDYFEIPLHTVHQLKGNEDSICLLLQSLS